MDAKPLPGLDQDWLQDAPYPLLVTDDSGRIRWVNRALEEATGLPASQWLDHNRDTLPSLPHRALLGNDDPIRLQAPGGAERWLRCRILDSRTAEGETVRLYCYEDISESQRLAAENRQLKAQLDELQLNDPLTGLPNDRAIGQVLNQQVSRSRRYDNPLSVLLVQTDEADPAEAQTQALARLLRDRMRWVDQLGRWQPDTFLAVLPETGLADARLLADKIRAGLQEQASDHGNPLAALDVHFSMAAWRKGDDARTLLRRARDGLAETEAAGNG